MALLHWPLSGAAEATQQLQNDDTATANHYVSIVTSPSRRYPHSARTQAPARQPLPSASGLRAAVPDPLAGQALPTASQYDEPSNCTDARAAPV
jgi:hypothetical protein